MTVNIEIIDIVKSFYPTALQPASLTIGCPLKWSIFTQEQKCGPAEEYPRSLTHPDRQRFRQYLIDELDRELRRIHLIRYQDHLSESGELMDHKSNVFCLNRKGRTTRVIHDDLVATLGEEAVAYSTVTIYFREAQISPGDPTAFSNATKPHIDESVKNVMLTTVWCPTGFAVVSSLESECKFNAGYYVSEVLAPLSECWRERGGGNFGKLSVHADHARPHKSTVSQQFTTRNAMVIAVNPPCLQDLAPSDFHLFGHVKGVLRGESFETEKQWLWAIEGNLGPSKVRCVRKFIAS
jgi:hypothetical protein